MTMPAAWARVFASPAAVALTGAQIEESLHRALETRNLIGQSQGILMERFGLLASKAFELLRRVSQNQNIKLREVAARLVTTRRTPGSDLHESDTTGTPGKPAA